MATINPPGLAAATHEERLNIAQMWGIDFDMWAAMGYIKGLDIISYGCSITDFDAADGDVLFYEAILSAPAPLAASTVYICSSNAGDTGTYKVHGLDANGDFATANVTATGTTPAAIPGTWNHIQRCIHTTALGSNAGTVYVSTDSGAVPSTVSDQIQTAMLATKNYAINPVYMVPNNHYVLINRFDFSTDSNALCTISIDANRQGTWIENFIFYTQGGAQFAQDFHAPLRLDAGDMLRVRVDLATGTGAKATFGMNGIEMRNDLPAAEINHLLSVNKLFEPEA